MSEIEFPVGGQPRTGEVAGADDSSHRLEAIPARLGPVAVEEVRLGVQEAALIGAHGHVRPPQEGDQLLDRPQHVFRVGNCSPCRYGFGVCAHESGLAVTGR
jgi:hypothetical protein